MLWWLLHWRDNYNIIRISYANIYIDMCAYTFMNAIILYLFLIYYNIHNKCSNNVENSRGYPDSNNRERLSRCTEQLVLPTFFPHSKHACAATHRHGEIVFARRRRLKETRIQRRSYIFSNRSPPWLSPCAVVSTEFEHVGRFLMALYLYISTSWAGKHCSAI